MCPLQGENENGDDVDQWEEDQGKDDFSKGEKETTEGCAELLAFAFGHGVRE